LHTALATIADDDQARVVVIAGAGPAFCAGHDLKQDAFATASSIITSACLHNARRLMLAIQKLPQPVIGARARHRHCRRLQLVAMVRPRGGGDWCAVRCVGHHVGCLCHAGRRVDAQRTRKQAFEMLVGPATSSMLKPRALGSCQWVAPTPSGSAGRATVAAILAKACCGNAAGKQLSIARRKWESPPRINSPPDDGLQHDRCVGAGSCQRIPRQPRPNWAGTF